jgi:hypothetical protein
MIKDDMKVDHLQIGKDPLLGVVKSTLGLGVVCNYTFLFNFILLPEGLFLSKLPNPHKIQIKPSPSPRTIGGKNHQPIGEVKMIGNHRAKLVKFRINFLSKVDWFGPAIVSFPSIVKIVPSISSRSI